MRAGEPTAGLDGVATEDAIVPDPEGTPRCAPIVARGQMGMVGTRETGRVRRIVAEHVGRGSQQLQVRGLERHRLVGARQVSRCIDPLGVGKSLTTLRDIPTLHVPSWLTIFPSASVQRGPPRQHPAPSGGGKDDAWTIQGGSCSRQRGSRLR